MFNPSQIQELREALTKDPTLKGFAGAHLNKASVVYGERPEIVWTAPASSGAMRAPARVFGSPEYPSCMHGIIDGFLALPAPIIQAVDHARVIGNSAVIDADGRLYLPKLVTNEDDIRHLMDKRSWIEDGFLVEDGLSGPQAVFWAPFDESIIKKTALFLHNLEPANYGSFLIRQLPQMLLARQAGLAFDCYVTPTRTSWFMEALRETGLPELPVFSAREVAGRPFQKILLPSAFDAEGFYSPEMAAEINGFAESLGGAQRPPKRFYASRLMSSTSRRWYRVLQNEPEIERIAHRAGFEVFYPETLSFREQVRTFASATQIFGPSGSGLLNAIFTQKGGRVVDLESFHVTVRQHAKVYASTGKIYGFGFGHFIPGTEDKQRHHRPWVMPEDDINAIIDWLGASID
ncbi:glycosyltransferase family 61 protein [Microvirga arabica]|uniref:glycosyltransferase family 61 protein n=1 Tax=Microvirga arabica TaxID=1128671 RepID=UPI001939C562|nr:glycosyltransferase 61 family protein [Microvirga arabica]MBM1171283.1 DUF563 domain-containing protein [Microvirga arabica]